MFTKASIKSIGRELQAAVLGDARRTGRAVSLIEDIAMEPGASFPRALNASGLEALYRFVNNEKVSCEALIQSHATQVAQRAQLLGKKTLVLHDTTIFRFNGEERQGLGPINRAKKTGKVAPKDRQGFYGHFSLAVDSEKTRAPLGVVSVLNYVYPQEGAPKEDTSTRWLSAIQTSEERLPNKL